MGFNDKCTLCSLESDDAIEYSENLIIRCCANEVRPEVLHSSV